MKYFFGYIEEERGLFIFGFKSHQIIILICMNKDQFAASTEIHIDHN